MTQEERISDLETRLNELLHINSELVTALWERNYIIEADAIHLMSKLYKLGRTDVEFTK
jgi:hypothetical protein